ncbi:hypothetical protein UPYG_G00052560 [Umbra pygmaea]|uniref:C2H2-type domain-containing protein n=1 Tax=Umbra pygmaea TaxID=75934 RepID=A0ABD0X7H2_UMBPY
MTEPKSQGSGYGDPAKRCSKRGPEMVPVKLEDCSQPFIFNVIVKEEEEEREIKGEEVEEILIKEEIEKGVNEEVDERRVKEEEDESLFEEDEMEDSAVKEEEENRDMAGSDLGEEEEDIEGDTDPGGSSNPGSGSEPSSPSSVNHEQQMERITRPKHHQCMDCFTSFYEPEELRRHTSTPQDSTPWRKALPL